MLQDQAGGYLHAMHKKPAMSLGCMHCDKDADLFG